MLIWVPVQPVADALAGLDGADVEVVTPDGDGLPASAAQVEFYVRRSSRRPKRSPPWPGCRTCGWSRR